MPSAKVIRCDAVAPRSAAQPSSTRFAPPERQGPAWDQPPATRQNGLSAMDSPRRPWICHRFARGREIPLGISRAGVTKRKGEKHVNPISLSASSKREVLVQDSSRSLRAGSRAEDGGSTPASRQIWQGAEVLLSKVQQATAGPPGAGAGPSPRLRPEGAERTQGPEHHKSP